jgi:SAM-dependent methyltransferase
MDFDRFDTRRYETLEPREGYARWAPTYEDAVVDAMDIRLLDRLERVRWDGAGRVIDLACGSGRTGAWLRARGVGSVDGLDFTAEMLDLARGRGAHDRLIEGDVRETGLVDGAYDLAIMCLADEHLPDLAPLYGEVARITGAGAQFVIVGYHPHFLMLGVPTHFTAPGEPPKTIRSHVHLFSDHLRAATSAGFALVEAHEGVIDDDWVAAKPKWEKWRGHPVSYAFVWAKM